MRRTDKRLVVRNDNERQAALVWISEEEERIGELEARMRAADAVPAEQVTYFLEPLRAAVNARRADVTTYEQFRAGVLPRTWALKDVPRLLVALRMSRGLSQAAFGKVVGLHANQVSKYETSAYQGVTLERIAAILFRLGVHPVLDLSAPPAPAPVVADNQPLAAGDSPPFVAPNQEEARA